MLNYGILWWFPPCFADKPTIRPSCGSQDARCRPHAGQGGNGRERSNGNWVRVEW